MAVFLLLFTKRVHNHGIFTIARVAALASAAAALPPNIQHYHMSLISIQQALLHIICPSGRAFFLGRPIQQESYWHPIKWRDTHTPSHGTGTSRFAKPSTDIFDNITRGGRAVQQRVKFHFGRGRLWARLEFSPVSGPDEGRTMKFAPAIVAMPVSGFSSPCWAIYSSCESCRPWPPPPSCCGGPSKANANASTPHTLSLFQARTF